MNVRLMNIINAKWWHQWCDYTDFDLNSAEQKAPSKEELGKRSESVQTYNRIGSSIGQSSDLVLQEI